MSVYQRILKIASEMVSDVGLAKNSQNNIRIKQMTCLVLLTESVEAEMLW